MRKTTRIGRAARTAASLVCLLAVLVNTVAAQSTAATPSTKSAGVPVAPSTVPGAVVPPPGYVIGSEDVLSILFWREKNLSVDTIVRPDGMISLPLLNDIHAAGLTTDELRQRVMEEASKFVEDSTATVFVKQINSRKVFITGNVAKPGVYPLTGSLNVLQLIAVAGGLLEFADGSKIQVMRTENGTPVAYPFNYKWLAEARNLKQNIELKPGDTIVVP